MPADAGLLPDDGGGQALRGLRVVSLAEQYPGPFATMILADLGADVILVERIGGGDPTRRFPGHFEALNRGKRSVALDLKSEPGTEVLWRLLRTADVLIEGFRPGVMERLGFGTEPVAERCPGLVYCSISAFGQTGPLARAGGHDLAAQGMAGYVDPNTLEPAPLPLADVASALFTAVGVLASVLANARGATARRVDVSMLDSLVALRSTTLVPAMTGLAGSPYPPHDPGYGTFRLADGRLGTLSIAGEDHQWRALCEVLGLDDLASLPGEQRDARRSQLRARLASALSDRPFGQAQADLAARAVALQPVHFGADVADDPQIIARNLIARTDDEVRYVRQPVLFSGPAGPAAGRAPRLGQHTAQLLHELGFDTADVRSMFDAGLAAGDVPVGT